MQRVEVIEDFERQFNNLRSKSIRYFEVAFQDLSGVIRGRILKPGKADDILKGFRVDAFSTGFTSVENSDVHLLPDPHTLRLYRTRMGIVGFLIGDFYIDGKPFELYPRNALKEVVGGLRKELLLGAELEFYLARNYKPLDMGGYMDLSPYTVNHEVLLEIIENAREAGVEVKAGHHEVGPGQYEIVPPPMNPLELADTVVFLKKLVWETAARSGLQATFMPKPFEGLPGNGMHLHISYVSGGRNLLVEEGELTSMGSSLIGGLLTYARPFTLLTNPTVNSYKRLTPGFEAPVYLSWGRGNRSTMIRVPVGLEGLSGTVEFRLPDSSGNIYLKVLSTVFSVSKGLEDNIKPPPECHCNVFESKGLERVPQSLGEALEIAGKGVNGIEPLKPFIEKISEAKRKEWIAYLQSLNGHDHGSVTQWEIKEYFYR
ncbi:MAG: glutamine synthetase family protein [Infirmifilum sp.]